jgi:hypothetical protein
MLRYVLAALLVPTTCFAILPTAVTPLPLDPALIAGMTTLILAQIGAVQLRSSWEKQRVSTRG